MTSAIKSIVSKNKIRYKEDGFNLDLSYISRNVIAMGFPAEKKIESIYRNHIDDVVKFLNDKHRNHYKIYNLCSEEQRRYDINKFGGPVESRFSFPDHNPPPFVILKPFCEDLHQWLTADDANVAAVHCKAGKGRTGVMICTYLVHAGSCELENGRGIAAIPDADSALEFYGRNRTHDRKGVTIPSQKRYVHYYDELVKRNLEYRIVTLKLSSFTLSSVPITNSNSYTLICEIYAIPKRKIATMEVDVKKGCKFIHFVLDQPVFIEGDIRFAFYYKKLKREKLFQFWINTFFVEHGTDSCTIAVDPCRKCPNTSSVSVNVGQSFFSSTTHKQSKEASSTSSSTTTTSGGRASVASGSSGSSIAQSTSNATSNDKSKSTEELEKPSPPNKPEKATVAPPAGSSTATSSSPPKHSVIDINFFSEIYSRNFKDDRFCDCNADLSREYPASCTGHQADECAATHTHVTAADFCEALNLSSSAKTTTGNGSSSLPLSNGSSANLSNTGVTLLASNGSNGSLTSGKDQGKKPGILARCLHQLGQTPIYLCIITPTESSNAGKTSSQVAVDHQSNTVSYKSGNKTAAHQLTIDQPTEKTYELSNKNLFLVIPKHKLDKANKDKSNKTSNSNFNVVLNFVPTLNSSGTAEGRKLSNEAFVRTYDCTEGYCVTYKTEQGSSTTESDDEDDDDLESDGGGSSDAKASPIDPVVEPQQHSSGQSGQCSEMARKQVCSKKNISGTETTHL